MKTTHKLNAELVAGIIAVEVEDGQFGLADALRTATWYALEIDPTLTSKTFADGAALCGLHHQGARNRFNEGRNELVEMNQL